MNDKRIGILGFAHGHVHTYIGKWRAHPEWGATVVAGWDHDAARLADAAGKYGLAGAASVDALLAEVDAVVIAAETAYHAELTEQAAAAGKAIVVQKPLALTLDEADRMVKAVERAGVPFSLAWQMRVDPHNLKIKELLASGDFGRVYMVRRRHCLNSHTWSGFESSWHVNPTLNRDLFADDASHPMDFIYWLLGMPETVTAELGTLRNPAIVNDNGIALFRYADGTFAEVSCTFVTAAGEGTTEVVCEKGTIVHNYGDAPSTNIPWPQGGIQLKWFLQEQGNWTISDLPDVKNHGERLANLAQPLAAFFHGGPPVATVQEGRDVLRMMLGSYDANAAGKRVRLT